MRYPERGRLRDDLLRNLRSFPASRYMIHDRIIASELQIIRILYGSRDPRAELQ